jgi:hypothetical protein
MTPPLPTLLADRVICDGEFCIYDRNLADEARCFVENAADEMGVSMLPPDVERQAVQRIVAWAEEQREREAKWARDARLDAIEAGWEDEHGEIPEILCNVYHRI